jgi:hypothetical protein
VQQRSIDGYDQVSNQQQGSHAVPHFVGTPLKPSYGC